MYLTPTNSHWACDIEADELLDKATRVWCVCVENVLTGEKHAFTDKEAFKEWLGRLPSDYRLVGHNFLAYDLVMLNRHWGTRLAVSRIVDTFVLSQLYNPSYAGGHSLEAWGSRLKFPKTEHEDFSCLTPEMLSYCANDTSLTALLFRKLTQRMRQFGFTESGAELESLAWNIIQNKQRRNGFPFNYEKAHELYVELRAREEELRKEIHGLWPPRLLPVGEYKSGRKRDGSLSAQYHRHQGQYPKLEWIDEKRYRAYDWVEFNLGSPQQRVEKLLELGWTPTQFTKKTPKGGGGNPKVDEDSLTAFAELSGKHEVKSLAKWIVINSRANMVATWLNAYDEKTGCIHGRLFIASTLRYRHAEPNSANIPAVRTKKVDGKDEILYGEEGYWTYECRDLYTSGGDDWSLVGIDGKGIQLRVLANYAYSEEFLSRVLDGDPHTNNIKILGLANKPAAKKFLYTTLMGGQGARLAADQAQFGTILSVEQGKALRQKLIDSVPGFQETIDELQEQLRRSGRIRLCDGTPIIVPSPHMVIPYLLQGDESRLMKKALIYVDEEIRRRRLTKEILKVADIHDEWQWRVRNKVVQEFTDLALPCFPLSGQYFNYRVPIEGDVKVGKTWATTH